MDELIKIGLAFAIVVLVFAGLIGVNMLFFPKNVYGFGYIKKLAKDRMEKRRLVGRKIRQKTA